MASPNDKHYELRYFGHALLKSDEKKDAREERGLQLVAPGRSYVEAFGTVYSAAAQVLGLGNMPDALSIDGMRVDPTHSIEKLHHYGFLLLRLDEFLRF